jgi:hypothetical protein
LKTNGFQVEDTHLRDLQRTWQIGGLPYSRLHMGL